MAVELLATPVISFISSTCSSLELRSVTSGATSQKIVVNRSGYIFEDTSALNDFTANLGGLNSNTEYECYSTATDSQGLTIFSDALMITTLTCSSIIDAHATSTTSAQVTVLVDYGNPNLSGGKYAPTTTLQLSTDNLTWSDYGTTTSQDTATLNLTGLTINQHYYARLQTTTTAGTSTSSVVDFTTPNGASANIDYIVPSWNYAEVFISANSIDCTESTVEVYYRLSGSSDPWTLINTVTVANGSSSSSIIPALQEGLVAYDVYLHVSDCGTTTSDSTIKSFATLPVPQDNQNCNSLNYLTELICQVVNAIKSGNMPVYANQDTKDWCDPEDPTPTVHATMTRVKRFMDAVGCLACSVINADFTSFMGDNENMYYTAQLGWQELEAAPTDGSSKLLSSGAVQQAIAEFVQSVWHYYGTYDFYARDAAELDGQSSEAISGNTGIIGDTVYTFDGTSWGSPTTITPDNFGAIHINSGAYAENGFYWFVDSWNRLDLDISASEEAVGELENIASNYIVPITEQSTHQFNITVAEESVALAALATAPNDTMMFITSPADALQPVYYGTYDRAYKALFVGSGIDKITSVANSVGQYTDIYRAQQRVRITDFSTTGSIYSAGISVIADANPDSSLAFAFSGTAITQNTTVKVSTIGSLEYLLIDPNPLGGTILGSGTLGNNSTDGSLSNDTASINIEVSNINPNGTLYLDGVISDTSLQAGTNVTLANFATHTSSVNNAVTVVEGGRALSITNNCITGAAAASQAPFYNFTYTASDDGTTSTGSLKGIWEKDVNLTNFSAGAILQNNYGTDRVNMYAKFVGNNTNIYIPLLNPITYRAIHKVSIYGWNTNRQNLSRAFSQPFFGSRGSIYYTRNADGTNKVEQNDYQGNTSNVEITVEVGNLASSLTSGTYVAGGDDATMLLGGGVVSANTTIPFTIAMRSFCWKSYATNADQPFSFFGMADNTLYSTELILREVL